MTPQDDDEYVAAAIAFLAIIVTGFAFVQLVVIPFGDFQNCIHSGLNATCTLPWWFP